MSQTFICPHCNQSLDAPDELLGQTVECPSCQGKIALPQSTVRPAMLATLAVTSAARKSSGGLIAAGYICGVIALLFFPPGFGVAGLVIGIVNLTKGRTGHGIAQIVISITCAIFGMIIGAATWE